MKVIATREPLATAIRSIAGVVKTRTPKPVLGCFRLHAANNTLTLSATDLEVYASISTNLVQVEQEGAVLASAEKLTSLVADSTSETVVLDFTGPDLCFRDDLGETHLPTLPASDFPSASDPLEAAIEVSAKDLLKAFRQTKFASAKESTRYAFNGILLAAKGKVLQLVATEGHMLSAVKIPASCKKDGSFILPAKVADLMLKSLEDAEETVKIGFNDNACSLSIASLSVRSNTIEGQFPPYDDVIPKDTDKKLISAVADMAAVLRRGMITSKIEETGKRCVRAKMDRTGMKVSTRSEGGETAAKLACKYEGADIEIRFNANFALSALSAADTQEVSIEMTAPNRPLLFRFGSDFRFVLMPANLQ